MNFRKIIALLLAALCAFGFAACGGGTSDTPAVADTTASTGDTPSAEVTGTTLGFDPGLPEDLNYEGAKFTILDKAVAQYNEWGETSIWIEEDDGDVINSAIYRRNREVEEKLNIEIAEYQCKTVTADIQKSVSAGEDAYQCVMPAFGDCGTLASSGFFMDLYDMPYMDFTERWWDQSSIRDLSIADRLYFVASDISMLNNDATWCTMFSKVIVEDFSLESPYDLVEKNAWTMDNFYTLYSGVSHDLDGDGELGSDDFFANLTQNENYNAMFIGGGDRLIAKDSSDIPIISIGSTERTVGVLDKLIKIMRDEDFSYNYHDKASALGYHLQTTAMFQEGRGLFWVTNLQIVIRLRDLVADFGIVPVPKYDENQEEYANVVWTVGSYTAVPVSCADTEFVGAVLETMAAKSCELLKPAYYDVALTSKFLRDEESAVMLDLVFSQRVFDLGLAYNFGGITGIVQNLVKSSSNDISQAMAANGTAIQAAIDKVVDSFGQID